MTHTPKIVRSHNPTALQYSLDLKCAKLAKINSFSSQQILMCPNYYFVHHTASRRKVDAYAKLCTKLTLQYIAVGRGTVQHTYCTQHMVRGEVAGGRTEALAHCSRQPYPLQKQSQTQSLTRFPVPHRFTT